MQLRLVARWDDEKPAEFTDPLSWWQSKALLYPRLAPSERLFSVAGITIATNQASILPKRADRVIFLRENMERIEEWLAQNNGN